ncbi:MAG: hypothetical protein JWQ38_8 [Flavipsychrobacter sp.]|nr:hypothetical protein [Flavipsychrobacter sp.]
MTCGGKGAFVYYLPATVQEAIVTNSATNIYSEC